MKDKKTDQEKGKGKDTETEKKTSLVKYRAADLLIDFPDNKSLAEKEKSDTRNAIQTGGIVANDGQAFISKGKMPTLLCTDQKGANKVYNDLDNDDKFQDGSSNYASASALTKELSKRIQEPRPQLERERLKDSRDCINAFIDSPQLEKERSIESDRIQKELPKLTQEKMKKENIQADQLTGEKFNHDAEGHHIERKADNPKKATDSDNLIVVKQATHQEIHKNNAEGREALKKLAEEKHWSTDHI